MLVEGVVVHLDFGGLLRGGKCTRADLEAWSPPGDGECVLGRRVSHLRRRRAAQCVGGAQPHERLRLAHCPCTSWLTMASTPSEDRAPAASLDQLKAHAAPTHPGAQPQQRGGSW